jgi:hypothetical protein
LQTEAENATMESIADGTGGKAFIHDNDLKGAVDSALQNGSSFYTVGYVPPAKTPDEKFHQIQVHVEGKGLTVSYRSGYYEKRAGRLTPNDPAMKSVMASAVTYGAPPATQVLFKAHLLNANDPSLRDVSLPAGPAGENAASLKQPLRRYVAELVIDPNTVSFDELPDGKRQLRLEVALLAFDEDGKRVNYLDRSIELALSPSQLTVVMGDGIRARIAIDVPPGAGALRIAVQDLANARAGSLEIPIAADDK